ncbi:hypothetical protein FGO68_gene17163 [Halteria grandinella]|uniref:MORN repeat protein n=1 Tax=Halteria grandinella TaxID=5974 RepID=A0A8J8T5M8_HALGN|nr:hypothetical protein FGO68_gene17163 [Halteria grandinella]
MSVIFFKKTQINHVSSSQHSSTPFDKKDDTQGSNNTNSNDTQNINNINKSNYSGGGIVIVENSKAEPIYSWTYFADNGTKQFEVFNQTLVTKLGQVKKKLDQLGGWKESYKFTRDYFGDTQVFSRNYSVENQKTVKRMYLGEMQNNLRWGYGVFMTIRDSFSNGYLFEGKWVNDNPTTGRLIETKWGILSETSVYEGSVFWNDLVKDIQYTGNGTLYLKEYNYTGMFLYGKKNGEGTQYLRNGEIFWGKFQDDYKFGNGILLTLNGTYLEGYYTSNLKDGYFYVYDKNHRALEQRYYKLGEGDSYTTTHVYSNGDW